MTTTIAEAARFALVLGGLILIGFNAAIYAHLPALVYAVRAWRWFMVGKTLLTAFLCWSLWDSRHDHWSWRLPLALAAMTITIISLVLLEREHRQRQKGEET